MEIPKSAVVRPGGARDKRSQMRVEFGDLGVKECDTSREAAERELRGVEWIIESGAVGAQSLAARCLGFERLERGELLAQLAWRGEDHITQLQHRRRPGFDRALACDTKLADRLDDSRRRFRRDHARAAQDVTGGQLGVDRVGFPTSAPCVWVGLVDFTHPHLVGDQVAGQRRSVGACRLHPNPVDLTECTQPPEQLPVARTRRRK